MPFVQQDISRASVAHNISFLSSHLFYGQHQPEVTDDNEEARYVSELREKLQQTLCEHIDMEATEKWEMIKF